MGAVRCHHVAVVQNGAGEIAMELVEAQECCPTCGGAIVPTAELYRVAWDRYIEAGVSKKLIDLRDVLGVIAIQLAHRAGRCADKPVCPGAYAHIGSRLVPGRVPRCPVCHNEVEVDSEGEIAPHLLGPRLKVRPPSSFVFPAPGPGRVPKRGRPPRG